MVFVAAALLFAGCGEKKKTFDIDLIVGKWVSGSEYWRYDADGGGGTWDEGDDVHEDEAQPFRWEYDSESNRLTQIHQMEMGGVIPKSYTLVDLTDNTLSYKDRFDSTYVYKRVM